MKKTSQIFLWLAAFCLISGCSVFGGGEDEAVSLEPGAAGAQADFDVTTDEGFAEFDSPDEFFFEDESGGFAGGEDFLTSEEDFFAQELGEPDFGADFGSDSTLSLSSST